MPGINGYAYFLYERQASDLSLKGKAFKELQRVLDREWNAMSPANRAAYHAKAKEAKRQTATDCFGRTVNEIQAKEAMAKKEKADIVVKIDEELKAFAVDGHAPAEARFFVADVNTWYMMDVGAEYTSPPAEVGVVELSLEAGVERAFHALVHHGAIPLGKRADMMEKCERRHKIEIDHVSLREDWAGVVDRMEEFLVPQATTTKEGKEPHFGPKVLFVMPEREPEIRMALQWLWTKAGRTNDPPQLFPLPQLLFALCQHLVQPADMLASVCPNVGVAAAVLDRTVKFFYAPGIACEAYHADLDCENGACALAKAKMLAFLMCSFMCPIIGVEMWPGRHVPGDQASAKAGSWGAEFP